MPLAWRALVAWLLVAAGTLAGASPARAYTVGGGLLTPCHELLTFEAMLFLVPAIEESGGVVLPASDAWRSVAREVLRPIVENPNAAIEEGQLDEEVEALLPDTLSPEGLFILFSAMVGVRVPDTEGHSVADLKAIRQIHADPTAVGQYAHALRGLEDDGVRGDVSAIRGAKQVLRDLFEQARLAQQASEGQLVETTIYLDYYGQVQVPVNRVAFLFGRVAHLIQDSFSHMVRSADGLEVVHVLNYADAIGGSLDESRDGMAHSESLDDCTGEVDLLEERALQATLGAVVAFLDYLVNPGGERLELGLSACPEAGTEPLECGWITYNPACEAALDAGEAAPESCCTRENDYCGSPWVDIAREEQSGPYLQSVFGCAHARVPGASRSGLWAWPVGLGLMGLLRVARRRRRARAVAALGLIALLGGPDVARAQPPAPDAPGAPASGSGASVARGSAFVGVEGHASAISDVPNASVAQVTLGYGLRGGYRWGSAEREGSAWGLVGQLEINHWKPGELYSRFDPGALNFGVGGEYSFAAGRLRSSALIGTSTLLFDAAFDEVGTTGLFFDLRPLGVRWPVGEGFALVLDPFSLSLVQPALGDGPDIRMHEYRTSFGVEWSAEI